MNYVLRMAEVVRLAHWKLFWPFTLFFGWLLSFPVSGSILYQLATVRGFNGDEWSLFFSFSHAFGFLCISLFYKKFPSIRHFPLWGAMICLSGTVLAWFIPVQYGPWLMVAMGLASSVFVMGCCYGYTQPGIDNKLRFIATVILLANVISYFITLLCGYVSVNVFLLIATVLLLISFRLPRNPDPGKDLIPAPSPMSPFPFRLLFLVCVLIFGLDINGGFMYQVIFPYFEPFREINRYYYLLPYMGALIIVLLIRRDREKMHLVYIGSAMLGLGFVFFALLKISLYQYFLINTLILGGYALLDLFIWTILGEIAENHGRTAQVFGWGLFANVLPLAFGGLLGAKLRADIKDYPVVVSLLASATIFLTSVIFPLLVNRIRTDLLEKEAQKIIATTEIQPPGTISLWNSLLTEDPLTAREQELLALILDGYTNEDIANRLVISVNTVKVHVKSIIRKFGVSNKNELLALIIKTYHQNKLV